jgi:DNA-directed RNA polymerase subunit RPC12/RpoP
MESAREGVGRIIIRCHKCGAILYNYAIGDKNDRNKFNGPPLPKKALSGFDGMRCPMCGTRLSQKPISIRFHTKEEFESLYVEDKYRLLLRSSLPSSMLSVQSHADSAVDIDDE